jgi:ubiquinone/menaquinone biosynthesis C-methylase UbiE
MHDLGAFAVGVDIYPGENNPLVVFGDFHKLVFPDQCCDIVYTNALDHAMCPEEVIAEVTRVLDARGLFILDAVDARRAQSAVPKRFESFWWDEPDALLPLLLPSFGCVVRRVDFTYPWPGTEFVLGAR